MFFRMLANSLARRMSRKLLAVFAASRESVLLLFLSEGAVLGLAGGLLAAATGSFLGQWLVQAVFESEPELHPALAVLSPVLGLMIVLAGSIWPAWQSAGRSGGFSPGEHRAGVPAVLSHPLSYRPGERHAGPVFPLHGG